MGMLVARRRTSRFGSYRAAHEKSGISVGTWDRIEKGKTFRIQSLWEVVEALGWPASAADDLLAGIDPDSAEPEGTTDYGTYVAETPDHVQRTIDDLLMQHSASFRRARGGT